jgi:hypothetical protein
MIRRALKRLMGRVSPTFFERLLAYSRFDREFLSIRSTPLFSDRRALWEALLSHLEEKPLCFLEFGVWEGNSMRYFARQNSDPETRFYGFDSFEGLPESWASRQPKGSFSTNGRVPEVPDNRVVFVKGWFNQTLGPFLSREQALRDSIRSGKRTLLVHFDADLFSSTVYVLAVLSFWFDQYYFIFDEFIGDESRALSEASRAFGLEPEFYGHTLAGGYPLQVIGKLQRRGLPDPKAVSRQAPDIELLP